MHKQRLYEGLDEPGLRALAKSLGSRVFPGAFLAFYGGLGAGKTTFVQAVASALGVDDIQSPTFTIVREHRNGRLPLFHLDAYRLAGSDELFAIGFSDYLDQDGLIMMEWSENIADALPGDRLDIRLAGSGQEPRSLAFSSTGPLHDALLEVLP